VTVHIFGNSVTTAIQQYAIEKGFYRDEGLDVVLQLADASIGVQLAATGQVDFTASVGSAIAGAVRNVPVKTVFVSGDRPPWWMYTDPGGARVLWVSLSAQPWRPQANRRCGVCAIRGILLPTPGAERGGPVA
jgi:hypothetical protein